MNLSTANESDCGAKIRGHIGHNLICGGGHNSQTPDFFAPAVWIFRGRERPEPGACLHG